MFETFKIQGKKVLRDSPSIYEMNQSQQNKITTSNKSSENTIPSSLQIKAFTEKKQLHISKSLKHTIQDKEIQDSPSMHEMKQMQHLNMVTTKQQKSSQMLHPVRRNKSPLQVSQSSKRPISPTSHIVTAFSDEKQSRFP